MIAMYGKHFASTYTGSMLGAGPDVFAVWGYVIANTIKSQVELNPKLLAAVIGMPEEAVKDAIEYLCSPDENSRRKVEDGRRLIREGEFSYRVTGHATYRAIRCEDDRREYNRIKQAEYRAAKKSKAVKDDVIDSQSLSSVSAHTEAEAEADLKADATSDTTRASKADDSFDAFWDIVHRKVGKEAARKAFTAAAKRLRFVGSPAPQSYLIERMRTFAASPAATPTDHTPIHPATWLNQGRYDDDQSTWQTEQQTTKRAARLTR